MEIVNRNTSILVVSKIVAGHMKSIGQFTGIVLVSILFLAGCSQRSGKPRVLVFTKTAGYHHNSIAVGVPAITKLGNENNFDVDTTSDASRFTEDSLSKYAAVIFLNTTGDLLNNFQEADFERYIQSGGGFVGIHAAADAEYDWGWYGRLVGAYFESHPQQQEAVIKVIDSTDESTKHLPRNWKRKDEWYNFKNLSKDVHVLLEIEENSYTGGTNGNKHPMAWQHEYDGGRVWYTELGHTDESYSEANYLKHLLGGIKYAIGDNKKPDYKKAKTLRVPEEDRFTKVNLVNGEFFEPNEMTILPGLDILISQRRGEIMMYKQETKTVKQVGFLNVYWKALTEKGSTEMGLLGIQADPDFAKNHFVYVYYSPSDTSVERLSRFTFEKDSIDPASEKIILQFYAQREICCHTGGSIAFDKDRNLFVSTGDNSTPFDEPGKQPYNLHSFAPLDDREGFLQYDARRSPGNTNDLRGKILRIRVKDDGNYEIPEGNLFPKGTEKTRPEIYVMGNRNPYRISVDKKNGFLYWGEVGPDANVDSLDTRGPRGYDEVNQARKAGNFGWPYFVGNNYAYYEYDYATGKRGNKFDPQKPLNNSRNNTGLIELPPAQAPLVWYPYGESKDFPQVGTGGRTAMAGPVYYSDLFDADTKLPEYYNNKFFMYDWIRGWIKVVTLKENGDFDKMEPFMATTKFNAPVDMELGPDGKLYMLEYGNGWFTKNADAGLVRIDYNAGNRSPRLDEINVSKTSGSLPFKITATVKAKDPENDPLTYTWHIGKETKETTTPTLDYSFNKAGDYEIFVTVKDNQGASAESKPVAVYAGNDAPEVAIRINGNQSFYFPGLPVQYEVLIDDKNDTSKIKDIKDLFVSASYMEGSDKAISQGHQQISETVMGKNLLYSLDCKTCHKVAEKSIGPSFADVAKRYQKDGSAGAMLVQKIIKGGSGNWGEVAMAAHPNLKEEDARLMVNWIRSLASADAGKSLPAKGTLSASLNQPVKDNSVLSISAIYSDKGGNNIKPLTGSNGVVLYNSKLSMGAFKSMLDFSIFSDKGVSYAVVPKSNGWIAVDNIDLTGISKASLTTNWIKTPEAGYTFELRADSPTGPQLGSFVFDKKDNSGNTVLTTNFEELNDGQLHKLYIVSKSDNANVDNQIALSALQFFAK
jgi:cytochrome c